MSTLSQTVKPPPKKKRKVTIKKKRKVRKKATKRRKKTGTAKKRTTRKKRTTKGKKRRKGVKRKTTKKKRKTVARKKKVSIFFLGKIRNNSIFLKFNYFIYIFFFCANDYSELMAIYFYIYKEFIFRVKRSLPHRLLSLLKLGLLRPWVFVL